MIRDYKHLMGLQYPYGTTHEMLKVFEAKETLKI